MRGAPGTPCSITLDMAPGPLAGDPEEGDQLRTEAGTWYLITKARRVNNRTPLPDGVTGRWHLSCVRLADRDIDFDGRTIAVRWHKRERARR